MPGILYGVSVGPGDPEAIAVKGARVLQAADVVAYPAGRDGKLGFAQQIVAPWLRTGQQQLPLHFALSRDPDALEQAWSEAGDRVLAHLRRGESVAFACEGDASFYGTFAYLARAVRVRDPTIAIEVIPGVCSPLAAAAATAMPLVLRDQTLAVLPALYDLDALRRALDWADVVVLLKVGSVYAQVWEVLRARGLLGCSWAIERAGSAAQVIHPDLRAQPALELPYFSLLVVQVRPETPSAEVR